MTGCRLLAFLAAVAAFSSVADDVLFLDESGRGATGRFRVLDHEGDALGLMVSADDKFVAAASSARIAVDSTRIIVTIDCPVPPGMTAQKDKVSAWAGDGVELFVRPSLESTAYYQYSANAAGVFAARRNTAPDVMDGGWRSSAVAEAKDTANGFRVTFSVPLGELFESPLKSGGMFGINFTRCGKTCGGLSTWAAVGSKFSNIDAFGRAVYGGTRAYFERRLVAMRKNANAGDKVARVFEAVSKAVSERGDDLSQFSSLEEMFSGLEKSIISASLAGKALILFRPESPWGNMLAPDEKSRPLETLRTRAARNSRAVALFAAANLTDSAFVGQFNNVSASAKTAMRQTNYKLSKGFAISDRVGRPLYDPIMPLPMNSVLCIAPRETVPIYLEIDTHGLAAGVYRSTLSLKKSTAGFTDESIALEVDVVDADLDEVAVDRAGYDYVGRTFASGDGARNVAKLLVDRGYNVVFMTANTIFPREQKDGRFTIKDFGSVDRHLDAVVGSGLPSKRMKLWIYLGMEPQHTWNAPMDVSGARCPFGGEKWEKGLQTLVREVAAHVKARYGIGRDRIYWYPIDEPSGEIDDPTFKSTISRAYHAAKIIKQEDSANLTMTDPLPKFLESKAIDAALPRLAEVYDVIELYRPKVTLEKKRLVAAQKLKEVWTYSILTKENRPVTYRRDYWENMRDGYREIATFWHMTQAAGSPFDSTDFTTPGRFDDYASLYADLVNDTALLSRRQVAADIGFEDMRLITWLRNRFRNDPIKRMKIEAIVKEAADVGTMSAMDEARERLFAFVNS